MHVSLYSLLAGILVASLIIVILRILKIREDLILVFALIGSLLVLLGFITININ